ncbi:MAG: Ig-like domain-containing protein [Ilumatobacteraceae bacterium]
MAVDDTLVNVALPFSVNVVSNDTDPDGGTLRLVSIDSVSLRLGGSTPHRRQPVAFEPDRSFSGTIVIVYTVADEQGRTDRGAPHGRCRPSAPPTIANQTASTSPNTPVDVKVLTAAIAGVTLTPDAPSSGSVSVVVHDAALHPGRRGFGHGGLRRRQRLRRTPRRHPDRHANTRPVAGGGHCGHQAQHRRRGGRARWQRQRSRQRRHDPGRPSVTAGTGEPWRSAAAR